MTAEYGSLTGAIGLAVVVFALAVLYGIACDLRRAVRARRHPTPEQMRARIYLIWTNSPGTARTARGVDNKRSNSRVNPQ